MEALEIEKEQIPFHENFRSLASGDGETEIVKKSRGRAWDKLLSVGFPESGRHEDFQYMSLNSFFSTEFKNENSTDSIKEFVSENYLTFVNGQFLQKESSYSSEIVVLPYRQAYRSYSALLSNSLGEFLKEEKDPFALLNAACFQDGLFIYVPPKFRSENPLQILNLITSENSAPVMPRIFLFQAHSSELDLVSIVSSLTTGQTFCNELVEVHLEENARLNFIQTNPVNQLNSGWLFQNIRASLKKDAKFNSVSLLDSFRTSRTRAYVQLLGEGGEADLSGLSLLDDKRQSHYHITCDHRAPHTQSMQLFKSILKDDSQTSFQGKIIIKKDAQKTEAYQLNKNLLLSSNARANCKPNLEISADDVKASHGATVGQLDKEQLFYLKARGYNDDSAKDVLISSFAQEVYDKIPHFLINEAIAHMESYRMVKRSV